MLTNPQSIRIAIIGAGRIGSAFGFQLARFGGHDVTAIARPGSARLTQLQSDQAIVSGDGERAGVHVASSLDEETPYDLVILTCLAHQIEPILPALKRSAATCILFMFNTFEPERLQATLGAERCAFGMPFVQANLDRDGRIKALIGAGGQKTMINQQRWVDRFNAAGLPAILEPEMLLWLRCHVPFCVAFESISIAAERRGGGASWNDAFRVARGVNESFALIKGLGYAIYPKAKKRIDASPRSVMAAMLWFMSRVRSFRQLLATGEAECRALVDVMVATAPLIKPPSAVEVSKILAMKPS